MVFRLKTKPDDLLQSLRRCLCGDFGRVTEDAAPKEETDGKDFRLTSQSLKEIVAFDRLCFPNDFWQQEDWENLLEDECAIYYALLDGEQIVAGLFLYNWQGKRDYVKIMKSCSPSKIRKQGLGERLLRHAEREMRQLEMTKFCGETRASSNHAMQRLFTRCGYRLEWVEENYYQHPDESAYKYILQIRS